MRTVEVTDELQSYLDGLVPARDRVLARIEEEAHRENIPIVDPHEGMLLYLLVKIAGAKRVLELGTATGYSGIWLLRGMLADGLLTSVDVEPEHQSLARQAFTAAGFAVSRYRLIGGRALDVLPRLNDAGYDMVFCDADKQEYPDYLTAALRLLRPGGIALFDNALWGGRVPDPSYQDEDTTAIREVCERFRSDEQLVPLLLPVGDGLLAAVKRGE